VIVLNLLVLAAITPISYNFPVGVKRAYEMQVGFDGYIPLMGGRQAKVQVDMSLDVQGLAPDDKGRPQAVSDLTAVKILFNGTAMPFDLQNVKTYFPKTTVSISPGGRVLKSDAPDILLPARLPGLDAKRFPDITYVPLEFPEGGIELGKEWSFKRTIAGADATYTVKPSKITDQAVDLDVKIDQTSEAFEDANHNPSKEADGAFKVTTTLTGKGQATFDRALGVVSLFTGQTTAVSSVVDLKNKKAAERRLLTTVRVQLKKS
jgi:hypothetical protein